MYQKYNVHGHVQKNEVIEKLEKVFDENTQQNEKLEAKIGKEEEPAVPLSLVVLNLTLPPPWKSDLEFVKSVLEEIKAPNVDIDVDVNFAVQRGVTRRKGLLYCK